jgi:hypothetical protein
MQRAPPPTCRCRGGIRGGAGPDLPSHHGGGSRLDCEELLQGVLVRLVPLNGGRRVASYSRCLDWGRPLLQVKSSGIAVLHAAKQGERCDAHPRLNRGSSDMGLLA